VGPLKGSIAMWNPFKKVQASVDSLLGQKLLGALVRHGLNALGAVLVSKGIIGEGDWTEVSAGLAVALTSLLWSAWQKHQTEQVIATALLMPPGSSRALAERLAKG
jgi:hypothetical protein